MRQQIKVKIVSLTVALYLFRLLHQGGFLKTHTQQADVALTHVVCVTSSVESHGNTHGSSLKLNYSPHSVPPSVHLLLLSLSSSHTNSQMMVVMCTRCVRQRDVL